MILLTLKFKKMKKCFVYFVMLVCLGLSNYSHGQISVTAYSHDVVGLGLNHDKLFSSELKYFSDRSFGNGLGIIELDGFLNFKKQRFHQLSIGMGLNFQSDFGNVINAVTMPINISLYPFKDFQKTSFLNRLSFVVQLIPEYYPTYDYFGDCWNASSLIGVRYKFLR